MNAELLMLVGGATAFGLTLYWVRRRDLSEKHALGWLVVASLLLILGLFPQLIEQTASSLQLSYPSAVLFASLGVIYIFGFGVSVALCRLKKRIIRLLQTVVLLETRIRELEGMLHRENGATNQA